MLNFLLTFIFLLSLLIYGNAQSPVSDPYRACFSVNFTQNSTYQSNLNLLLSNLSADGPARNRFFNTSVGRPPNDVVYGLFQCRGDVTDSICRNCLATATRDIARLYCPLSKGAVIWYDECIVRYSDQPFFSVVSTEPSLMLLNTGDVVVDKEMVDFNNLVTTLLNGNAETASSAGEMFATQQATFTDQTVYTLAQCTGDLSNSRCRECLTLTIKQIPFCCIKEAH